MLKMRQFVQGTIVASLALPATILPAYGIVGGVPAPQSSVSQATVEISSEEDNGNVRSCTGTMIASNIVLTADHCFNSSAHTLFDVTAAGTVWGKGYGLSTKGTVVKPPQGSGDVNLIVLEDGVEGITPINNIRTTAPKDKEEFSSLGWGNESNAGVAGSPLKLIHVVSQGQTDSISKEYPGTPVIRGTYVDGRIKSGDSGGPLFDKDGNIIGITSLYFEPSNGDFTDYVYSGEFSYLSPMKGWIEEEVAKAPQPRVLIDVKKSGDNFISIVNKGSHNPATITVAVRGVDSFTASVNGKQYSSNIKTVDEKPAVSIPYSKDMNISIDGKAGANVDVFAWSGDVDLQPMTLEGNSSSQVNRVSMTLAASASSEPASSSTKSPSPSSLATNLPSPSSSTSMSSVPGEKVNPSTSAQTSRATTKPSTPSSSTSMSAPQTSTQEPVTQTPAPQRTPGDKIDENKLIVSQEELAEGASPTSTPMTQTPTHAPQEPVNKKVLANTGFEGIGIFVAGSFASILSLSLSLRKKMRQCR